MSRGRLTLLLALLVSVNSVSDLRAQVVHEVEIEGDRDRDRFRFRPARITVKAGDVVRFTVASGPPHSVVFDSANVAPRDRATLDAAIPDRMSLLSGPLLTRVGQTLEIRVPRLSPGVYRFYCLPHRAYRAEGEMVVVVE